MIPTRRSIVPKPPTAPEPESEERLKVSREQLWAVVDAARVCHRRLANGRRDSFYLEAAAGALESALDGLPDDVWPVRGRL